MRLASPYRLIVHCLTVAVLVAYPARLLAQITHLEGHREPVYAVAYSPDGRWLASGSFDKTVRLWDRATGRTARTLTDHAHLVLAVAFSPDSTQLASGGLDKLIFLHDLSSGGPKAELSGLSAAPTTFSLTPDGMLLALADAAGKIVLIDAAKNETLGEIEPGADVTALVVSPDASQVLAATSDARVQGWSVAERQPTGTLALSEAATALAMLVDGKTLAVGGRDGTLGVYGWPPSAPIVTTTPSAVRAVAASPDGDWFATAGEDGHVRIHQAADGAELRSVNHGSPVAALAVRQDNGELASGGVDGHVKLWNPADGAPIGEFAAHQAAIHDVAYHPGGELLATAAADGTVRIWRTAAIAERDAPLADAALSALASSPDGKLLASGDWNGVVRVLNAADGSEAHRFDIAAGAVRALAFDPGGGRLLVAAQDPRLRIITLQSGGVLTIEGQPSPVRALTVHPGGGQLAAGGADGVVRLWNLADGAKLRELAAHEGEVVGLAYAADGAQLVTAGDRMLKVWNLEDGSEIRAIEQPGVVSGFVLSADAKLIAVGTQQGKLSLYTLADETPVATLDAHQSPLTAVALSRDGRRLLTAAADKSVKLWDTVTRQPLLEQELPAAIVGVALSDDGAMIAAASDDGHLRMLPARIVSLLAGHEGAVHGVAFTPDGSRVVTAGADKMVRLWNPDSGTVEQGFEGLEAAANGVALAHDGKLVVATSTDGRTAVWNTEDGAAVATFETGAAAHRVAVSASGQIAVAGEDQLVRVYDLQRRALVQTHTGHTGAVSALAYLADGTTLVSGGADDTARLWTSSLMRSVAAHQGAIRYVGVSVDGQQFVTIGEDGVVARWNVADLAQADRFDLPEGSAEHLAVNRPATLAATASADGTLRLWNLLVGKPSLEFAASSPVTALAVSDDETLLHVGGEDGRVRRYRLPDGLLLAELAADAESIAALAISGDGQTLVSGGADAAVKQWPTLLPPRFKLEGHGSHVYSLAFNADGSRLASAAADKGLKLWNTADGQNYANCEGHDSQVYGVAFHPAESQLASCGADKTIRLWNPDDGKPLQAITAGINDGLYSIAYAPDGARLIAAGLDKNWLVYNTGEDQPALTVSGHSDHVYRAVFNPAGTRVATIGYAGNFFIWDAESGNALHHEQLPVTAAYSLAYSPDGNELAIATSDARVILFAVPDGVR